MSQEKTQADAEDQAATLLDAIANSMDWRSGFLNGEDLAAWRAIAQLLDSDAVAWGYSQVLQMPGYPDEVVIRLLAEVGGSRAVTAAKIAKKEGR
jgi:hypothetical protein